MRTPRLTERLRFYRRQEIDDGAGNRRGAWVFQFDLWAEMQSRPGSEVFNAARIEGRVPYQVRVRRSSQSMAIATDWMARDARGVEYNVQAPQPDLIERRWVDMVLVAGGVVG